MLSNQQAHAMIRAGKPELPNLLSPSISGRKHSMAPQMCRMYAGLRLSQEADDLFFGKTLLHVQSPSVEGLDSKSPCYSKPGGRREYSKTQQAGVKVDSTPDKPILGRSAQALSAWLKAAGIREGAIFRRIWKDRVGPALLPGSVAAIVKRRATLAGLKGDFGAHSLRSGFVTEAGRQGVPLPAVMAMTEHRSVASVIGYFQSGQAEDNPAARLLKD